MEVFLYGKVANGRVAYVDDEFATRISGIRWCARKDKNTFYATGKVRDKDGRWKSIQMHRLIMSAPKGTFIDHIDGNGLNNRISNLRFCTNQQNQYNKGASKTSTSHFKGVSWSKRYNKWVVTICHNGRKMFGAYFDKEEDAARYYDAMAHIYFGEFARLNFPGSLPESLALYKRHPKSIKTSKYRGVSYQSDRGLWVVVVEKNGIKKFCGRYKDEDISGRVYDVNAYEFYKEQAILNFPDEIEISKRIVSELPQRKYTSPYRGVTKRGNVFVARIRVNGEIIFLGTFKNEIEAAKEYDKAAAKFHGTNAKLNFPEEKTAS